MNVKTTLAEKQVLSLNNVESNCDESLRNGIINFTNFNWTVEFNHTTIFNSNELENLSNQIRNNLDSFKNDENDNEYLNVCLNHIPPMVFGNDHLIITYNNFSLLLLSVDAIQAWARQHLNYFKSIHGLNIIEVSYANKWKSQDNTLTKMEWDWTYSTDYCFSLLINNEKYSILAIDITNNNIPYLELETSSGIEYELLRDTSKPILFYDEINLYQDDLEDCGEVTLIGKVRVMPDCWYLLVRFYLRIDDCLLRIRDTRCYHRFGSPKIHIEILWRELNLTTKHENLRPEDKRLRDVLIADKKLQRDGSQILQNLPIVNDNYNIPRYYSIKLTT